MKATIGPSDISTPFFLQVLSSGDSYTRICCRCLEKSKIIPKRPVSKAKMFKSPENNKHLNKKHRHKTTTQHTNIIITINNIK